MLSATDPLPSRPTRIVVAGTTGAGKTTLAIRLAETWQLDHVEIDALYHGEGWAKRPSFEDDVAEFAARDGWITEWQYSSVRELLARRAQLMVWLDLPRRVARSRLVRRTLRRRLGRTELWNGNVEPPLRTFFTDPDASILRWEMKTHRALRVSVPRLHEDARNLTIVRLGSQRDVEVWLTGPAAHSAR